MSGSNVQLDWTNVYDIPKTTVVTFTLNAGTNDGYNDVISDHHTSDIVYSFVMPGSTLLSPSIAEVLVTLRAEYATGMSTVYRTRYKLI